MFSKSAWGGSISPFILVKFSKPPAEEGDHIVSLVVYEYNDKNMIGRPVDDDPSEVRSLAGPIIQ